MYKRMFVAGLALAISAGAAEAQEKTLKLAFFAPPQDPTFKDVIKPWADAVNAEGVIKIDTFPSGALGRNPRLQLKMVLDGVADMAWHVPAYTPGRFPDNAVMELPNIIRDVKESSIAFRRLHDRGLLRGYDKYYVPLLATTHPYFINTVKPVKKIADLKGLKLRAGGPVASASMKALGAVPVGMPIPAVAENISKGVLDGSAAEWNVMYAFRIVEVAKNHYMARLGTVPLVVLFNRDVYDGLSAKARASVDKHSGLTLSKKFGEVHFNIQGDRLKRTQAKSDHNFVFPDAAAQKEWTSRLEGVTADWLKKDAKNPKLLAALKEELAKVRAGN